MAGAAVLRHLCASGGRSANRLFNRSSPLCPRVGAFLPLQDGVQIRSAGSDSHSELEPISAASAFNTPNAITDADSSGSAVYAVLHAPVDLAVVILDGVHSFTGLPWWLTIVSSTLALRALLFPLTVTQLRKASQLMQLRAKFPLSKPTGMSFAQWYQLFTQRRQQLGAPSPAWLIAVPLVQVPVFISWIMAVRQMALAPHPGFDVGGALWFVDLSVPCQGVVGALFPLMVAWTYFISLQVSLRGVEEQTGGMATMMKFYKWGLEAATIPTMLIAFYLPQGVFMYWLPNNICSLVQAMALQQPIVRKKLGLPQRPDGRSVGDRQAGSAGVASDEMILSAANHVAQGKREEGLQLLHQAVEKYPDCPEAFSALGRLQLEKQQWAEAVNSYKCVISKTKDNQLLISAYFGTGLALHHQGKIDEAIEALRTVQKFEVPEDERTRRRYLKALVALGSVLSQHGGKAEALQLLQRAAEFDANVKVYVEELIRGTK